ncbi:hypothetical protein BU16DRAFT_613971 [Lophium mytilinum]|uniref:Chitin-binding type-1 domain-containing protein n=1 Tax=Lophium mytilinum TaxID=390894 RepID=A0A6A6R6J6_9PEZI|nr:hypothetical protein BU16DRAFT_613971 [Lophium mytilinum]
MQFKPKLLLALTASLLPPACTSTEAIPPPLHHGEFPFPSHRPLKPISPIPSNSLIHAPSHGPVHGPMHPPLSPWLWTDAQINSGAPFHLEVVETAPQRPSSSALSLLRAYILPNGNTTTACAAAAVYTLRHGELHSPAGAITVAAGVATLPFTPAHPPQAIRGGWVAAADTKLSWGNSAFSNGTARFYKLPANLMENAVVLVGVRGDGRGRRGWSAVGLWARDARHCITSRPHVPIPIWPKPHPSPLTRGGLGGAAAVATGTATVGGPLATSTIPNPNLKTSPNGVCGFDSEYTCAGSALGVCCSGDGSCHNSTAACTHNCQPSAGFCAPAPAILSDDGTCGPAKFCPGSGYGDCCSLYGYCGSSAEHCGEGCRSLYGFCSRLNLESEDRGRNKTASRSASGRSARISTVEAPTGTGTGKVETSKPLILVDPLRSTASALEGVGLPRPTEPLTAATGLGTVGPEMSSGPVSSRTALSMPKPFGAGAIQFPGAGFGEETESFTTLVAGLV